MPTYEQLYHVNLGNLSAAADRWEETVTKFKALHTTFGDEVAKPFQQAGWRRPVLTAAKADNDVRATHQEFADAQKEAEGIAGVLTTLHAELSKAKNDLHQLAGAEAEKHDLHVSATGVVTPRNNLSQDTGARHDPDGQTLIREQQHSCDAFARRIEAVLQRAADAEETACWALRRDLGGRTDNFNSEVVTSLDDARATRRAELKKKDTRTKTDGWVVERDADASGLGVGSSATGPDTGAGKLGEAEAHADLGRAHAKASFANGIFRLAGEAEAYAGAKATMAGGITNEGLQGSATGMAGGEGSAKGLVRIGPFGGYARAEALAGVEAGLHTGAGVEGLNVGGGAFAGGKGAFAGGGDIGGIGVGYTAEGWVGPGAEATLSVGKDSAGVWHLKPHVGASPLLGGGAGFEITVDPAKVSDTAGDLADAVGSLF